MVRKQQRPLRQVEMVRSIRVLVGLVLAVIAAAAVKLAFALTADGGIPAVMARGPGLLPIAAAQTLVFALPFSLPFAIWAEVSGPRRWRFFAAAGLAIATAGLLTQYAGEGPGPTIANPYAALAFATAGLVGGTVYWLAASPTTDRASGAMGPRPKAEDDK